MRTRGYILNSMCGHIAALLLFALTLAVPARGEQSEGSLQEAFHAGQAALRSGHAEQAVVEFKKVLALDPTLVEAKINLGLAYHQEGHYKDAAKCLAGAARERPNLLGPAVIAGMDYMKLRLPAEAVPLLSQAIRLDPTNADAHRGLAAAYKQLDDCPRASEQFRSLAELNPDKQDALFKLGHEYLELAAALAYRGARIYPNSAWGHRFLGDLLLQRDRPKDAAEEYRKALAIDPNEPGLRTAIADALQRNGDQAGAQAQLRLQNSESERSPSDPLTKGRTAFENGHYEVAESELGKAAGTNSINEEASYWLARTYLAEGAAAYAELERLYPESWRSYELRGEGFALRGQHRQAEEAFRRALELKPDSADLHDALGEAFVEDHQYEEAETEFQNALQLDPERTHTLYWLGRLYVQQHETEKAIPYLRRALKHDPDLAEASSLLGTAYVRLGRYADAVPVLRKASSSDHYGNVHYQLSVVYRKLGEPALAAKELARSHELRERYLERDEALIMGHAEAEEPQP